MNRILTEDPQTVLHSPFDYERHNKAFINYCEVIIHPDGLIEYGVPSHQEKIISIYCEKHNMSREEFDKVWNEDVRFWDEVLKELKIVWVWFESFRTYVNFELTEKQKKSLRELEKHKCCDFGGQII